MDSDLRKELKRAKVRIANLEKKNESMNRKLLRKKAACRRNQFSHDMEMRTLKNRYKRKVRRARFEVRESNSTAEFEQFRLGIKMENMEWKHEQALRDKDGKYKCLLLEYDELRRDKENALDRMGDEKRKLKSELNFANELLHRLICLNKINISEALESSVGKNNEAMWKSMEQHTEKVRKLKEDNQRKQQLLEYEKIKNTVTEENVQEIRDNVELLHEIYPDRLYVDYLRNILSQFQLGPYLDIIAKERRRIEEGHFSKEDNVEDIFDDYFMRIYSYLIEEMDFKDCQRKKSNEQYVIERVAEENAEEEDEEEEGESRESRNSNPIFESDEEEEVSSNWSDSSESSRSSADSMIESESSDNSESEDDSSEYSEGSEYSVPSENELENELEEEEEQDLEYHLPVLNMKYLAMKENDQGATSHHGESSSSNFQNLIQTHEFIFKAFFGTNPNQCTPNDRLFLWSMNEAEKFRSLSHEECEIKIDYSDREVVPENEDSNTDTPDHTSNSPSP